MILKRFYEEKLAQASFLVGCSATGEAIVIDPNRDIAQYLAAAEAENMRITAVTETHIHADFLSGARELAARAGAMLYLSAEGGPDWLYEYAEQDANVITVCDGDSIRVGNIRFDILHTPGHTPEHICFMLTDEHASDQPVGVFTGDFIFAGDVGRPDLLEVAAGEVGTMEASAHQLFSSLQNFSVHPTYLILWPGHGAGSACGKALGGMPVTTLGYEKLANWAMQPMRESEFVAKVLEDQPEPPNYFAMMKKLNRQGRAKLDGFKSPRKLKLKELAQKDQLLDVRPSAEFAGGYIPGSINVPLSKNFISWSGNVMEFDSPIHLVASSEQAAAHAVRDLAMIGFDNVDGWLGPDALQDWMDQHGALAMIKVVHPSGLHAEQKNGRQLIDVRAASEWKGGHIPGAVHIPLGDVAHEFTNADRNKPLLMQCQGGARSQIALSILKKLGFTDVLNLTGGYGECIKIGLPVTKDN